MGLEMLSIGISCILLSGPLLLLGMTSLMANGLHLNLGVKRKNLFDVLCIITLFLGVIFAVLGEIILY